MSALDKEQIREGLRHLNYLFEAKFDVLGDPLDLRAVTNASIKKAIERPSLRQLRLGIHDVQEELMGFPVEIRAKIFERASQFYGMDLGWLNRGFD